MATQTAVADQSQTAIDQPRGSVFDDIIDVTARRAAEWAKADALAGRTYGPGLGIAPELAALKIAFGRDFGFGATQSLKFIHVINGVPSLEASGRSNLLVKAGYSWKAVQHDHTTAKFAFYRHGEKITNFPGEHLVVEFSMKDAERAGYIEASRGKNPKGNYDKVPMNMLFARCLANFHRWYAPEVDGSSMADPAEAELVRVIDRTEEMITAKSNEKLEALREQLTEVQNAATA